MKFLLSMKLLQNYKKKSESFIICLDDDREFLHSLKLSLPMKFSEEPGYDILFMDNPVETLAVIRELVEEEEEIALIMTDQMMPDMKGIDFLKEAMILSPDSMRVLLTGHAGMDSAIVAINENILDKYLTKPIRDFEDLVFTLKRLLNEFNLKNTVDIQHRVILDLYQFSNSLNTLNSLDEILEHAVTFTRAALKCDRISILLVDQGMLCIKASVGIPEDVTKRIRIPLGKDIAGMVFKNREPILVKNIDEIPWIKDRINNEFKSFISAPVICAELSSFDVPLGVINVTNKRDNEPFSDHDLQTLSFIANTASIAINNQQNRLMLEQSCFDTIRALIMALEARDPYTKGHSIRVMELSAGIAQNLELDHHAIRTIKEAAILHDIGKIGIRDDVLLKAGRLDPDELSEIRKHPVISSSIVKPLSSLGEVGEIVRQHHERYDGNGYPDGLKKEAIHLGARIMAVADAYDAMSSCRPYRQALAPDEVMKEFRSESGAQFDPACVDALIKLMSENKEAENKPEFEANRKNSVQ